MSATPWIIPTPSSGPAARVEVYRVGDSVAVKAVTPHLNPTSPFGAVDTQAIILSAKEWRNIFKEINRQKVQVYREPR